MNNSERIMNANVKGSYVNAVNKGMMKPDNKLCYIPTELTGSGHF